ncbi:hypothetical protein NQZ68_035980 [Dissostichus eleginoides]|nr:hypothetical protein NQZ68_035980 [Dissostichus eleginoides]
MDDSDKAATLEEPIRPAAASLRGGGMFDLVLKLFQWRAWELDESGRHSQKVCPLELYKQSEGSREL